jgi:hypothetical protein
MWASIKTKAGCNLYSKTKNDMEIELARINVVEHRNDHKESDVPVKLKLQP